MHASCTNFERLQCKGRVGRSVLLRRTYREAGKVKHETLGNLSDPRDGAIEYIQRRLVEDTPWVSDGEMIGVLRGLTGAH